MPRNLSAIKKTQISLRNYLRNRKYKSIVKTTIKKYLFSLQQLDSGNDTRLHYQSLAYRAIDKAVKRGVIHRNNGARKKSMLAKSTQKVLN